MRFTLLVILAVCAGGAAIAGGPQPFDPGFTPRLTAVTSGTEGQMEWGTLRADRPGPAMAGLTADDGLFVPDESTHPRRAGNDYYVSTAGDDSTGTGSQGNPWRTIQHAIGAVSDDDTIHVAAGTYAETGQIVVDKNLTIRGEDTATTIVRPSQDSGSTGDARGWWLVNSGVSLTLEFLTLDGSGWNIQQGIRSYGSGTIAYCNIEHIRYSQYLGLGVVLFGNMTVAGCTFSDIERVGVIAFGTDCTTSVITGNTYVGKGSGDWLDYAVELGGGAIATVSINRITDCVGVALSDGSTSAGILATDYYGGGTHGDIVGNTISGCTEGVAIGYDDTDATTADVSYNSLAGNVSDGLGSTSTATIAAENNWWGDRTGPYESAGNPDGLGDSVWGTVDYDPWLVYPQVHLALGGARLEETQADDGGWGWPLDSPPNTIGPVGMGLCRAYRATLDSAMYAALEDAAVFLQGKTVFSPSDGYLAYELDTILGGTANRDYVRTNFYDKLAAGTYERNSVLYDTESYVQMIRDSRATQGIPNLAAWDVGMGLVGSHACGADTYEWILGTKAEINELNGAEYYDVIGLAGALYGLAYVGEEFNPSSGEHAAAENLADLGNRLAAYQLSTGGFTWNSLYMQEYEYNETVQETAYAILALNAVGGHKGDILDAVEWLEGFQLTNGGWKDWEGDEENNEITAEALWSLSVANLLALNPDADALYVKPGEYAQLYMDVSNLRQPVMGCQAMLRFSSTYFDTTDVYVEAGDPTVWNELIWDVWDSGGDLDVAVGVDLDGGSTDADGAVAKVRLKANPGVEGVTRMVFRSDVLSDPGLIYSTFLSDVDAQAVWPNKWDSHTIVIDNTPPVVTGLAAIEDQPYGADDVDVLDGTNPALQGTVEITVTATDEWLAYRPPKLYSALGDLKLTHTDNVTTLDAVYAGKIGLNDYKWTVDIGETAKNGQYNFSIDAEDMAGWKTTVSGYIVVNKNQITGHVEMDTYSAGAYGFTRDVVFKATDAGGAVLKTWTVGVDFTNDTDTKIASGGYTLIDVPDATANLSAKTAWSLRERTGAALDGNGQATAAFTGGDKLRGGDLNGSNSVNILDYAILKYNWFTTHAAADINADGHVDLLDYSIMKTYWFQAGDPE